MTIQEILNGLELYDGTFPRKALKEAIAKQEQITPALLKIIEHVTQNIEELQENYMAHIYALYLLAQFREERAYPLIVDFFSIPGEITLDLTGDVVTEYLGRILASVSGGDTGLMTSLVENEEANEYVRAAALDGLVILMVWGEKSREEVMAYLQSLFRGKIARKYSALWNSLVAVSTRLYPEEVYEDIKRAYEDGLVAPFFIGLEDVERALARGKKQVLRSLEEYRHYEPIKDTISEMEWWACFK